MYTTSKVPDSSTVCVTQSTLLTREGQLEKQVVVLREESKKMEESLSKERGTLRKREEAVERLLRKATAAGKSSQLKVFDAKLAFFDIGVAGAAGLRVPNDLARNMFPLAYTAGARIHTNV